jgi:hypothetical protein
MARPGNVPNSAVRTPSDRSAADRGGRPAVPRERDPAMGVDFAILADVS